MIVWGGYYVEDSEAIELNDGGHYNPTTDTWTATQTTGAPSARAFHSAVWTGNEMIVWGGVYHTGSDDNYRADGYRYFCDPVKK